MRVAKGLVTGVFLLLLSASGAAADVELSIHDGRVTLVATNATVRQILMEWARVGQTKIVNVERIPGGPQTLQLTNVPEQEALDLLLRSVTGYMAAQRPVSTANLSRYDRILVLPTLATARVPVAAAPTPVFPQMPQPRPAADPDDGPSIVPPRGPVFPVPASPQQGNVPVEVGDEEAPNPPPAPAVNAPFGAVSVPGTSAVGTPRPGMVVPSPVTPQPVGIPGQQPFPGQQPLPGQQPFPGQQQPAQPPEN